jgi:hypothetical protein
MILTQFQAFDNSADLYCGPLSYDALKSEKIPMFQSKTALQSSILPQLRKPQYDTSDFTNTCKNVNVNVKMSENCMFPFSFYATDF